MSNVKTQSSKEIQNPNVKYFDKKVLTLNYFDIPLSFACLPVGRNFDI